MYDLIYIFKLLNQFRLKQFFLLFVILFFLMRTAFTQETYKSILWNPATDSINYIIGQAWPTNQQNFYARLPASAQNQVRQAVWELSKNSAGLQICFKTNAKQIVIKYIVRGEKQMQHMPATGVSGLDLYGKQKNGKWVWAAGKYHFGDTIVCTFQLLKRIGRIDSNIIYRLYLPLYTSVSLLEINYPADNYFKPIEMKKKHPIVIYGTSIAQGACASRPGLAWANILGRRLDETIVNLGFSGNGRLEKEMLELISEIDAKLYVFDCLPNLTRNYVSNEEFVKRLANTIEYFHKKRPGIPLLFTEHDGYADEALNEHQYSEVELINKTMNNVIDSFILKGYKGLYKLSKSAIGQGIETTVDGTHPNDLGMMKYADAYEKIIQRIFNNSRNGSIIKPGKLKFHSNCSNFKKIPL